MGLFDKLTGSRDAGPGITPVPVTELRAALLALGESGSFSVADGAADGCDLVARWGTAVRQDMGPGDGGLKAEFTVKMRFREAEHEVHHHSQQSGSSWHTGTVAGDRAGADRQYGGHVVGGEGQFGFDAGGQSGALGYNFTSGEVTHPLRDAVTRLGWSWKAALFRL